MDSPDDSFDGLTPGTEARYLKINQEFEQMMQKNHGRLTSVSYGRGTNVSFFSCPKELEN